MKPVDRLYISVAAAKQHGIEEAIILDRIEGLVRTHKDDASYHEHYIRDGRAWATYTYSGLSRATGELLSPAQCRRAVTRLLEAGAVIIGHYGSTGLNWRASWYSVPEAFTDSDENVKEGCDEIDAPGVTESSQGVCRNCTMAVTESSHASFIRNLTTDTPQGARAHTREVGSLDASHASVFSDEIWDEETPEEEERRANARALFAPAERARVPPAPAEREPRAFERFWTRMADITDGHPGDKEEAGRRWNARVKPDQGEDVLAALEGYGASEEVRRGVVMKAVRWLGEWEQWLPRETAAARPALRQIYGPKGQPWGWVDEWGNGCDADGRILQHAP